jgi:transcriptional regulator with XRE-family HTH domain
MISKFYKKIGTRLKKVREYNKLSVRKMGKLLNFEFRRISLIEMGKAKIRLDEVILFASFFNLNINYFFSENKKDLFLEKSELNFNIEKLDNDDLKTYIANKIRELRIKHKVKLNELSNYLKVPKTTIETYENGQFNIPLDNLTRILNVFETNLELILL